MSAVKIIEVVGGSKKSWEDAINEALERTAKKIRNIKAVDVVKLSTKVENNKVSEFRADVKIAFLVE